MISVSLTLTWWNSGRSDCVLLVHRNIGDSSLTNNMASSASFCGIELDVEKPQGWFFSETRILFSPTAFGLPNCSFYILEKQWTKFEILPTWQRAPVNPSGHKHVAMLFRTKHVPLFSQICEWHRRATASPREKDRKTLNGINLRERLCLCRKQTPWLQENQTGAYELQQKYQPKFMKKCRGG